MRVSIFIGCLFLAFATCAETISGKAHVIDGDSLRIADTEIHLQGIDAPEGKQLCIFEGEDWACGETAAKAMKQIVGSADIRCTWTHRDRYERALGTCWTDTTFRR